MRRQILIAHRILDHLVHGLDFDAAQLGRELTDKVANLRDDDLWLFSRSHCKLHMMTSRYIVKRILWFQLANTYEYLWASLVGEGALRQVVHHAGHDRARSRFSGAPVGERLAEHMTVRPI